MDLVKQFIGEKKSKVQFCQSATLNTVACRRRKRPTSAGRRREENVRRPPLEHTRLYLLVLRDVLATYMQGGNLGLNLYFVEVCLTLLNICRMGYLVRKCVRKLRDNIACFSISDGVFLRFFGQVQRDFSPVSQRSQSLCGLRFAVCGLLFFVVF